MPKKTMPVPVRAEKVAGSFGPKGNRFHMVTYSDGSRKMQPGLSPFEEPEFVRQFVEAGYTEEEAQQAFAVRAGATQ